MIGLGIGLGLGHVQRGGTGGGDVPTPAPVFSVQPTMTPTSGTAGETVFTASNGTASNTTAYARRWLLSGTAIGTGVMVIPAEAGSLVLEVTATGPGGSTIATSAASTVEGAGEPEIPEGRVPELNTYMGRVVPIQQKAIDELAYDVNDPTVHTHMSGWTHNAVQDGDWHDPATWDTGTIPNGSSAVVNFHDFDVNITASVTFKNLHTGWNGTFRCEPADTAADLVVNYQTIVIHGTTVIGSSIPSLTGGGTPRIKFVQNEVDDPGVTTNGGIMTMSAVRIYGAVVKEWYDATATIPAGATSVVLPGAYAGGLRVGDQILFEGTQDFERAVDDLSYTGPASYFGLYNDGMQQLYNDISIDSSGAAMGFAVNHSEIRVVTGVTSGDVVSWSGGLESAHTLHTATIDSTGETVTLPPRVHNETRSVSFEGEPGTYHLMWMGCDDQIHSYYQVLDGGRTRVDPSLKVPGVPIYGTNGGSVITDDSNVIGRYDIGHWHKTGVASANRAIQVIGLVGRPSGTDPTAVLDGWGYVAHSSRVNFERAYSRGIRGAHYVWERGHETGQVVDATAIFAPGNGFAPEWGTAAERLRNHNGHQGVAFDMQARAVGMLRPRAVDCNEGVKYLQNQWFVNEDQLPQDQIDAWAMVPPYDALKLANPVTWGGNSTVFTDVQQNWEQKGAAFDLYGIEQANPPFFKDAYHAGCYKGFSSDHRRFVDRFDTTPFLMDGFFGVGTHVQFIVEKYSHVYGVKRQVAIRAAKTYDDGHAIKPTTVAEVVNPTWFNIFSDSYWLNFEEGLNARGSEMNYGGFVYDITRTNVDSEVGYFTIYSQHGAWNNADPRLATAWDTMGLSQSIGAAGTYPVLTRPQIINTLADFPLPFPKAPFGWGDEPEPSSGTTYPYCTDTSTDTTLDMSGGRGQCQLGFWVTDGLGTYRYGDTQNLSDGLFAVGNRPINCEPETLVLRNGCYQEGGAWKMPAWYPVWDRKNNVIFPHLITLTLENTTGHEAFLEEYEVADAQAALDLKPWKDGHILPEAVVLEREIAPYDQTAPVMTYEAGYVLFADQPLVAPLRSNQPYTKWTLGADADSQLFEIAWAPQIGLHLRWPDGGSRDDAHPSETGESYNVTIILANPYSGASTTEVIEIAMNTGAATATSLSLWSEDLSNAYWSSTGVTANAGVAPDGTTTADLITASGGTAYVARATNYSFNLVNNPDKEFITSTIAVKRSTAGQQPYIQINTGGGATAYFFDLDTGSYAGLIDLAGSNEAATTSIENLGNGWYRLNVTVRCAAATNFYFGHGDAVLSRDATDGRSMFTWGALVYEYPATLLPYRKATGVPANLYLP